MEALKDAQSFLEQHMTAARPVLERWRAPVRPLLERRWVSQTAYLVIASLLVSVGYISIVYTRGIAVSYGGERIGVAASVRQADLVRTELEEMITAATGEPYQIDDALWRTSPGMFKRTQIAEKTDLQEMLGERIGLAETAYSLYVDGQRVGATPYQGALEELIRQLRNAVTDENTISVEFAEEVEVREELVPTAAIMNLGYIARTLSSNKTEEVTYAIQSGDTLAGIAERYDLTTDELFDLNPGYDPNAAAVGDILIVSPPVPYLTMTVVRREHYVEDLPYSVEYIDSEAMFRGEYNVIFPGQYGTADVAARATYVNGTETERAILSYVTLKEPVNERRLRGVKERPVRSPSQVPAGVPTGVFRWPVTGRLSSYFGPRSSPGGIGSTNHRGIDIAAPFATPVCASDGGKVIYAGWMSGYGYLVQIDHGDGYVTYYAHNSGLFVSVGDQVYQGQLISLVGSTGNSTGNHCHFEIRYNGVAKNPLDYLKTS